MKKSVGILLALATVATASKAEWRNNSGQGQLQKRIEALEAAVNTLMGVTQ